jgi:hypothetical protein
MHDLPLLPIAGASGLGVGHRVTDKKDNTRDINVNAKAFIWLYVFRKGEKRNTGEKLKNAKAIEEITAYRERWKDHENTVGEDSLKVWTGLEMEGSEDVIWQCFKTFPTLYVGTNS